MGLTTRLTSGQQKNAIHQLFPDGFSVLIYLCPSYKRKQQHVQDTYLRGIEIK